MTRQVMRILALTLSIWLAGVIQGGVAAHAQPRSLDVPYVPTPENIVEAMLRLAKPASGDFLIDLGCGDGRIPVTAAKQYGMRGLGIDLNPVRILEAKANAQAAGVADKVEFVMGDLFEMDFSKATILTLYLLPQLNIALRPQILKMAPGTRIVSHAFDMDDWEPDVREVHGNRKVFYWAVPARIAGWWSGTVDGEEVEIEFRQSFQKFSGVSRVGELRRPIEGGRLDGLSVTFDIVTAEGQSKRVSGVVDGTRIEGPSVRLKRT